MKRLRPRNWDLAWGAASVFVVLALWELAVRALSIRPLLLPAPTSILAEIGSDWIWYLQQAWYTLVVTLLGFVCAVVVGVLVAMLMVNSRLFEKITYPLVVATNSVPKVALAPLFVIWLGTDLKPKVAIAFLLAIFPVIVDTVHGFRSVPQDIVDLGKVLRSSPAAFFFKVSIPCALPSIFAGSKVAISLSLVGAIVGEFVSSQRGLGNVILSAQGVFDTPRVFAAIVMLVVMSMLTFGVLAWLEHHFTSWRRKH